MKSLEFITGKGNYFYNSNVTLINQEEIDFLRGIPFPGVTRYVFPSLIKGSQEINIIVDKESMLINDGNLPIIYIDIEEDGMIDFEHHESKVLSYIIEKKYMDNFFEISMLEIDRSEKVSKIIQELIKIGVIPKIIYMNSLDIKKPLEYIFGSLSYHQENPFLDPDICEIITSYYQRLTNEQVEFKLEDKFPEKTVKITQRFEKTDGSEGELDIVSPDVWFSTGSKSFLGIIPFVIHEIVHKKSIVVFEDNGWEIQKLHPLGRCAWFGAVDDACLNFGIDYPALLIAVPKFLLPSQTGLYGAVESDRYKVKTY